MGVRQWLAYRGASSGVEHGKPLPLGLSVSVLGSIQIAKASNGRHYAYAHLPEVMLTSLP